MTCGSVVRLGDKVDRAESQRLEGGVSARLGMGAEQDHRQRCAAHDEAQRLHAIHARHFQIERNHVGPEFLDLLQSESAIHRGADDFDGRIAREDRGDELAHQRGVVHDEDADGVAHAIAPRGVARERRARTAGTLRISTTVPSPKMEAPLTKSLETISEGSALMTNSSSPTSWSTSKPKRFSAAPITITKSRFFL